MSAKTRDLGMTPLDDLFSTDESRAEAQLEKVVTLNPAEISTFRTTRLRSSRMRLWLKWWRACENTAC